MIRSIQPLLALLLVFSFSMAHAADGYTTIDPAQPTANPDKIEVVEVFWYGCPHCYDFEPSLKQWLETKPDDVEFIRLPAIFRQNWLAHARVYYAAEELDVVAQIHSPLFTEIHENNNMLESEAALREFFVQQGVDGDAFTAAYNSEAVENRIKSTLSKQRRYQITGVPAVVINGKYQTSGPLAGSYGRMIEIMDELIEKERSASVN
ncbi:MAG: thiol:disulfide interchange protein DsbA/DsbL [Gammaproteobacteria bacterium]